MPMCMCVVIFKGPLVLTFCAVKLAVLPPGCTLESPGTFNNTDVSTVPRGLVPLVKGWTWASVLSGSSPVTVVADRDQSSYLGRESVVWEGQTQVWASSLGLCVKAPNCGARRKRMAAVEEFQQSGCYGVLARWRAATFSGCSSCRLS